MSRVEDFTKAIHKRILRFPAYPNINAELAEIASVLDGDDILHDMTIVTPTAALLIGPGKTPFQNSILHVVNKGKAGNISSADMADAINGLAGPVLNLPPVNVDLPYVFGDATLGSTLSCTAGNWQYAPTSYAYQWQRLDPNLAAWGQIPGATSSGYVLVDADMDSFVACDVTATNASGSATSRSNEIEVV